MISVTSFQDELNRYVVTKADSNEFLNDVSSAEKALFKTTEKDKKVYEDFVDSHKTLFKSLAIETSDKALLTAGLVKIRHTLESADCMHLSLAFQPRDEFLHRLQDMFWAELNEVPLFDVTLNRSMLGGVIIDYRGKHADISFSELLKDYFIKNKDAILSKL